MLIDTPSGSSVISSCCSRVNKSIDMMRQESKGAILTAEYINLKG